MAESIRSGSRKLEATCTNSDPFGIIDMGCSLEMPICAFTSGYEPSSSADGDVCGKCVNNYDQDMFMDIGCSAEYSACDAPLGKVGFSCIKPMVDPIVCTNSAMFGGKDDGCSDAYPICVEAQTGMEVGAGAIGSMCAACVKVYSEQHYAHFSDYGCSGATPRCMTTEGTDPSTLSSGMRCAQPNGSLCPCNTPGSMWEATLNTDVPLTGSTPTECVEIGGSFAIVADEAFGIAVDTDGNLCLALDGTFIEDLTSDESQSCFDEIVQDPFSCLASV